LDTRDIDKQLRKEELKSALIKPAIIFAMIATGLFILWIATPKQQETTSVIIQGKALRTTPVSAGYGYDTAMIVELENGKEARVPMKMKTDFKQNAKVELKKIISADGHVKYEFNAYSN